WPCCRWWRRPCARAPAARHVRPHRAGDGSPPPCRGSAWTSHRRRSAAAACSRPADRWRWRWPPAVSPPAAAPPAAGERGGSDALHSSVSPPVTEDLLRGVTGGFLGGQRARPAHPSVAPGTGAMVAVLGIVGGGLPVRLVPVVPTGGDDVRTQRAVDHRDLGMVAPRPAQIDPLDTCRGSQRAIAEQVAGATS